MIKSITELYNTHKGEMCFVIGNGLSKYKYDLNVIYKKGFVFGCNKAFEVHPVDILGFRDNNAYMYCLEHFPGVKAMPHKSHDVEDQAKKDTALNVYEYYWQQGNIPMKDNDHFFVKESTGNVMLQLAVRMGFSWIILVGMDCCVIKGQTSSNAHKDDSKAMKLPCDKVKIEGKRVPNSDCRTSQVLVKFAEAHMRERGRLGGKAKIAKLGCDGILDIPVIEWEDVKRLPDREGL